MKKLLNISAVATLAILPLAANAVLPDADPGATNASAPSATYAPKYSLVTAGDHDDNVATAGYVKGAYNAAIKAINKVSEISANATSQTFDSEGEYGEGTIGEAIQNLQSDLEAVDVTQAGVVATIKDATASKTGVSLTVSGTPTGNVSSTLSDTSISGSVNIPTSATVPTLTAWGNDNSTGTATVTLATTATNLSGTVTGTVTSTFTGTGITGGTATGDITGIDVDVSSYNDGTSL